MENLDLDALSRLYPNATNMTPSGSWTEYFKEEKPKEVYYSNKTTAPETDNVMKYMKEEDYMPNKLDICREDTTAYFMDWLNDNTDFEEKINQFLEIQGYLTEGDLAHCLVFASYIDNPYIYYYGDIDKYRNEMLNQIIRNWELLTPDEDMAKSEAYKNIKNIIDALGRVNEYLDWVE